MKIFLATGNSGKVKEIKDILSRYDIEIISQEGFKTEVEETGKTFEENAWIKANASMKKTGLPAMADDSGLVVEALNGEPGIYSARYAGPNASDIQNRKKLLKRLAENNIEDRKAYFVCAICLVFTDGSSVFTRGECHGSISSIPKGNSGFGYDPIFITQSGKTFAQLTTEEKSEISHRGIALRSFVNLIRTMTDLIKLRL
jgi:XTP/dITP diphosphohydrolase